MRNTAVLVKWIEEHQANPYPTKAEKQLLAYYSGMNLTQLSTWFANARRRIKKIGIKTWLEGRSTFSLDYFPTSSLQRPAMPGYAGKSNSKPFQPTVRLMHAHARTCRHYTHMSMYMHKFMGTYIRKHAYVKKKRKLPDVLCWDNTTTSFHNLFIYPPGILFICRLAWRQTPS